MVAVRVLGLVIGTVLLLTVSTELQEQNGESLMEIIHRIVMETTKSKVAEMRRCPGGLELTQ